MKGSKENPKKERGRPTAKSARQQSVNSSSHANAVNSVHSSMIYMCFNVDSLLNKRNELNMMIGEENPFVFRVTEVEPKNCKPQTQEAELGFEKYKCFKNLKCTQESPGAIECREMADAEPVESVWCEVEMTGNDKLMIFVYLQITKQ